MDSDSTTTSPPPIEDGWALFLDVDGSLAEHAPTPDAVRIDPDLTHTLERLASQRDGAVALISGRSLQALDALFAPRTPALMAGLHGLERRGRDYLHAAPDSDEQLRALAAHANGIAAGFPGALVECRGGCLFLHWRAAPEAAAALTAFARELAPQLPGHRLHPGAHGIEIRPHGIDKGVAIAAFLREAPFRGRRPVFVGDDPADEPGFEVVNAHGGVSVLVGQPRPSAARYRWTRPEQVRGWLAEAATRERAA